MIRGLLVLIVLLSSAHAVDKTPDSKSGVEDGVEFRLIKKWRRYLFLAETKNRRELNDTNYHQVLLGSYYRITKRLRAGAFVQAEQGQRFDEDWVNQGGSWQWDNLNSRWDFASVLDATYNDKIRNNLVWEMKTRFYYYHSRDILQLRLRPGLRYFVLKFGRPTWQFFLENELYLPLNYGDRSIYEYWIYLGSLYQVSPEFSIGPVVSLRGRKFNGYEDFSRRSGQDYTRHFVSTYLGLNAVYSF